MHKKITVDEYFRMPETNRPQELIYGYVREPPTPFYSHQKVVGQLFLLLRTHVDERKLGEVCLSPMDVVLDKDAALILQPDLMFISNERRSIIRSHVWGAPDLVIEVASPSTDYRDRTVKLPWYRKYGVLECWFAYPQEQRIEVVDCSTDIRTSFVGASAIRSNVLPEFAATVSECF